MDFRFWPELNEWLKAQKLFGDGDIVALAGAVKNLTQPNQPSDRDLVLRQIEISVQLHGIKKVVLINHQDCGAYGGSAAFGSLKEEFEFHKKELAKAKKTILERFAGLLIELVYARIDQPADKPTFEFIG